MASASRQTLTWRDAKGQVSVSSYYVGGAAPVTADMTSVAAAVDPALVAMSNGSLNNERGVRTAAAVAFSYGVSGEYDDVEDKVIFTFVTGAGSFHRIGLPCPKVGIFLADKETVDPANALVATFTTAVLTGVGTAQVTDRAGLPFTAFVGGQRVRRRTQRRFNIITKNPSLLGPGL